jgi:hypothetical protein
VGIVQQNQIKKARKIQDDIRAEHERLVVGHLSRLRRAAAAELQADSAAKQVTMAWLQVCMSSGLNRSSYWGCRMPVAFALWNGCRAARRLGSKAGHHGMAAGMHLLRIELLWPQTT